MTAVLGTPGSQNPLMPAALALGARLLGKLAVPEPLPVSSHSALDNRLKTLGKVLGPGVFGLLFTSGLHRLWPNVQLLSGRSTWRVTGGDDIVGAEALLREARHGYPTPLPSAGRPLRGGPQSSPGRGCSGGTKSLEKSGRAGGTRAPVVSAPTAGSPPFCYTSA